MPGTNVTRFVKVTNNSGSSQRIATEAINKNDPDNFGEKLNLVIKEGGTVIFNNTLKKFFGQGETYLSSLANNANTQYDFTVNFNSDAGDFYQGKILGFDIIVGFEGTEGGLPLPSPGGGTGGGGGGGWLPPGLTIQNETEIAVTQTSVTITWLTSYAATSQVIYALGSENHTLNLTDTTNTPPKYGYAHTTPESDISPKVINHSVAIYGLNPATTYYYRAVSHASLAIGEEQSFTTLMPGGEVAGAATERGQETGQPGGRGGFMAATERESAEPTESAGPAAPAVAGESTCLPIPWWPFGYVLLLLILGTAQKMGKGVSVGGTVLWIALLVAALLWWWLEPCGAHFWVWPVLILIVFLVSLRFYLKKSSDEETPA